MPVSPLNHQFPIVDDEGRPTPGFLRWWQDQRGENTRIVDLKTAAEVSAVLDKLGDARGVILYRGASAWVVLAPGTDGFLLRTQGSGADPEWSALGLTELSDTPTDYTGQGGRGLFVNGAETGVEFLDPLESFLDLSDTPADYTGQAGRAALVNPAEDGIEFGEAGVSEFVALDDTPANYTGQAGKVAAVNGAEDGIEFVTPSGGGGAFAGFRALKNATQSIAASSILQVTYQVELFDTENAFASSQFTVPASLNGRYAEFTAGVRRTSAPTSSGIYIMKSTDGGSSFSRIAQQDHRRRPTNNVSSGPVLLETGHVFEVGSFASSSTTITTDPSTFFSGVVF